MSQDDVRQVTDSVSKKRRFDSRDWNHIADYICETKESRKKDRKDNEKIWKEIDRQIAMTPDTSHKLDRNGNVVKGKEWMPELELPLQAQTLEVLTADARRMMFPDAGPWFESHVALTDDYLEKVDFQAIVTGDQNEVPTQIDQDAADKMVAGVISHWHRQYDFFGNIDQINAEAFKYGLGIGRARLVDKRVFQHTAKGVVKRKQKIPVLFPVSIKTCFPDDSEHRLMNEGHIVGPSMVRAWNQLLTDVKMAAEQGGKDPNDENGGWMPANFKGVESEKDGTVELIEMEGDFIVPRKTTGNIYIPNAIATVMVGKSGSKVAKKIVRFRFRNLPLSSYIQFPYHVEHLDTVYPSSPLIKGWPIQKSAVDALSRIVEAGALNTQPPMQYDDDDVKLASQGGPQIYPGALWGATGTVTPHYIGDPGALFSVYAGLLQQYADTTGINAPRLGQQTVSHTTAFAKEAELQRGTIRTVDYVRATLKGPMAQWLHMAYELGRSVMSEESVYIDAYNGFVDLNKERLPERVTFEAHGAGGPQEEAAKQQQKLAAVQQAIQMDQLAVQMGNQPSLNLPALIEQTLREGGWTDVDVALNTETMAAQPTQAVPGIVQQEPVQ